jgi:dTDP-4-dehydrorhamnose reductase
MRTYPVFMQGRELIFMKVLILGGSGMLGSECKAVFSASHQVFAPGRKEMDIVRWDGVIGRLQKLRPHAIVNCAGISDLACSDPEDLSVRKTNVEGPRNLAQGAARFNCKLLHVSSDLVFDGQKPPPQPYFEDDAPNPLTPFGRSKMDSEIAVKDNAPDYIIVRTGWLYGTKGNNFVKKIIREAIRRKRAVVEIPADYYGSPTWAHRLAQQVKSLIDKHMAGTYHATAEGSCSLFGCVTHVIETLSLPITPKPAPAGPWMGTANRPLNNVLENRRLKTQGLNLMVNWKADLDTFLENHGDELIREVEKEKPGEK